MSLSNKTARELLNLKTIKFTFMKHKEFEFCLTLDKISVNYV